jgi:capsule polysaccharide export protein KpsC/LpsZ
MRAGGLIAVGVFLMQWSATHCLQHFEELATSIFKPKNNDAKLSWSQSLQQLLRTCIQDHRYSLLPIEKAFLTGIGPAVTVFNPLQTNTKTAVTATNV